MVVRNNLSQRNGTCVRTNSPGGSNTNSKGIKSKLNTTTTTGAIGDHHSTTTTTIPTTGSSSDNHNNHNTTTKRVHVSKRPSFVNSGICFILSYYIWTIIFTIHGEISKLSITITDVTHHYKPVSSTKDHLITIKSVKISDKTIPLQEVQYEESSSSSRSTGSSRSRSSNNNNINESILHNTIRKDKEETNEYDDDEQEETEDEGDDEKKSTNDDEEEDKKKDEDKSIDTTNKLNTMTTKNYNQDTNKSNPNDTATSTINNNDNVATTQLNAVTVSKPLVLISSTISDQISNRIRNNNNPVGSYNRYHISNEIQHERWKQGECTAESLDDTTTSNTNTIGRRLQYIARPYGQNRTLAVLLYTTTPINNNKYQQKIIQSFLNNVVLPNDPTTIDIAILYYHSDVPVKQNIKSINAFFIDFFQGYNIKYIWPIDVTKYKKNEDWGLAIEDIIQNELNNNENVNSTSVLYKLRNGRWRDMILRNVRPFNDEYTITGGIRPCYYIMTRYQANRTCAGIHGVSSLLLYYQLQQHLLYGPIPTSEKQKFVGSTSVAPAAPIDLYDRFIFTHSNMYHVCEHPNVVTALDPNYIWTPSALETPEITDTADQLGIPISHWIVSYQHITNGLLNIVPNLLTNFQYYMDHENVADHTVQRLVRSVWQYQCLLPYHRRFHRTMISASYTSYKSTLTSLNNVIREIDDIRWKYPKEYETTQAICNAITLNTLDSLSSTTKALSLVDRSVLSSTIPDPNYGAKFALPTAAVDDSSYVYPVVCTNNTDDDESNVLPLDDNDDDDDSLGNKTLVIIIGSLRGGEIAWDTLYKNVLDYNNADLALLIGDTREAYQNATLFQRAKYYWKFQEYTDWAIPIDTMIMKDLREQNNDTIIEDWRKSILPHNDRDEGVFGGIKGYKGSGAIIMIIRYFLQQKIKELNLLQKYERFVVTRADHYYLCTHDLSELSLDYIWTPDGGSDFWGVTDRHLVVSNKYILQALDILPIIFRYPKSFIALNIDMMNPERLIRYSWHLQCLLDKHKQFPRVMFTCGVKGDTTRWEKLKKTVVPEGVQLKYSVEYYASHRTCRVPQSNNTTRRRN